MVVWARWKYLCSATFQRKLLRTLVFWTEKLGSHIGTNFEKEIIVNYFFKLCRGLFLIDPNGVVRHCLVNDLPVGRNVDEALRILKAFQYFEKHGEGWLLTSLYKSNPPHQSISLLFSLPCWLGGGR
jgi:hypothetical protein